MVKIAIAGGSGQVAREVIDALVVAGKHDIAILSRNASTNEIIPPGVHWRAVDYSDKNGLTEALRGTHTVLSFVQLLTDPTNLSQRNLIDASIAAGVKRFAPSEYGSARTVDMPWSAGKEETRNYLRKVNENGKVLEFTLFQPGLFLDYLASPHQTAKYVAPLDTLFDFNNRRAILVEGHEDAIITFTSVADLAAVVAQAVDFEAGEWPEVSGIRGNRMTFSQVVDIGEKIRGPFTIDKVKLKDLEAGVLRTSWGLATKHRAVTEEQASDLFKTVLTGILLSSVKGAWDISDELNHMFPHYKFEEMEAFLTKAWDGKP
ncbi:hypothetical protein B0H63DRAFT_470594 [Podospora didyma]|uniref:NmrA-like domain-containing protein n=1 Tax=Podospora didyma TaxID=330526 RepID=A0AAE0NU00_9PEZI|nr:hypothetical protein B0H63DRAFT_470594 [Podospora didyma]